MTTAFASSQQGSLGHRMRSGAAAARGREAPMDFNYDHSSSSAGGGSSSNAASQPFLAALQAQARARQQARAPQQGEEQDADTDMADVTVEEEAVGIDGPASQNGGSSSHSHGHGHGHALPAPALRLRQFPVGGSGSSSLYRNRSHSKKAALLGAGADSRDTTMEDVDRTSTEAAEYVDLDAGRQLVLQSHAAHNGPADSVVTTQHHFAAPSKAREWIGSNVHHMDWPELLLGHAQVVFNTSLLAATLYLLFLIARTVQRDVEWKWLEYRAELETHIAACRTSFERNHCASPTLGVDFQAQCALWARCMQRDPNGVGRARVFAETVADIANGFVDRVSWKTMAFTLLCLFIVVGGTNSTLSSYRHAYAARRNASQQSRRQGQSRDRRSNRNRQGAGKRKNNGIQQAPEQRDATGWALSGARRAGAITIE